MNCAAQDGFSSKFIYKAVRKRAPLFAVTFALLFTVIAVGQYLFVRNGVYKSAQSLLSNWAEQVAAEIGFKDHWDLAPLRQSAELEAPHIFVFTSKGLLVECSGFVPGLISSVTLPDNSIFTEPKTITVAETGETWREYGVRLKGGTLALGILNPQDVTAPDEILKTAAHEFGATIDDALKTRTRQVSTHVDYAVISDSGDLLFAADWFSLKADPASISRLASNHHLIHAGANSYLLGSKLILDASGDQVGTIIVPKEVTAEERVIRQHIVFNGIATLASWLAALFVVTLYLAVEDWRQRPQAMSLDDALKSGESQFVEFKEGYADVPLKRAIAAFANTNSGTIFLGVNNSAQVVGIDCDSPIRKDQELQRIRSITADKIKPAISVRVDFISHDGKTVVRIFIPRGEQPLYFLDHEIYVREQTASMKATPEQVEAIVSKFYR